MIKISKRLKAIGDFVPDGSVLLDVGTDHALLIVYLFQTKKIKKAYGLDIAKKPLAKAQENIMNHGLDKQVEVILSDGLKSFDKKADAFVMAGMGAETIWKIIEDYAFDLKDTLILQANSKQAFLRQELSDNSFEIVDESFILDMNRNYTILKVRLRKEKIILSKEEALLGPILMKRKDSNYMRKLKNRRDYLLKFKKFNKELKDEFKIIDRFLKEQAYE